MHRGLLKLSADTQVFAHSCANAGSKKLITRRPACHVACPDSVRRHGGRARHRHWPRLQIAHPEAHPNAPIRIRQQVRVQAPLHISAPASRKLGPTTHLFRNPQPMHALQKCTAHASCRMCSMFEGFCMGRITNSAFVCQDLHLSHAKPMSG